MKHKKRFVTPRLTQAVGLYPEDDMLLGGSVMYDIDAVSAGQLTNSMTEGDEGDNVFQSYWE